MRNRITKVVLIILLAILTLFCIGVIYNYISLNADVKKYPMPGKLVDMGGYKLHINCSGNGGPSVILDAFAGGYSLAWAFVQPGIAQFTHVCSYDRAGLGWSEETTLPRTAVNIVKELHELLHKAEIPEPYILVGHSIGGINMRLYANTYPDEIYGVVLVDSSHELQEEKIKEINLKWPDETPSFWQKIFHWLANSRIGQITGLYRIEFKIRHTDFNAFPESIRDAFISRLILPSASRTMAQERAHFEDNFKLLKDSKNLLENKPLIVITRGKATEPSDAQDLCKVFIEFDNKIWQPLQKDLVAKSKKSKQIIAEKSCHMIPFDQPEIIVEAVKALVYDYHAKNTNNK